MPTAFMATQGRGHGARYRKFERLLPRRAQLTQHVLRTL
ncbi:hypothetical protein DSM3645_04018 [Blastopirellula marina DSM 3645]|uniref:Uncharacterized protein n=1 Tax=Blastopirellula marina DSM 3645 TaxID=314230 RepID=A3ZV47_9BACT|nr:hypothetical protein DSM3645_04018 [Blastopirellula marina DSM 3645]